MRLIKPSFKIEDIINGFEMLKKIEKAGRTCYKSENKINNDSCIAFIKKIIKNGHHTVLEHEKVSVRIICDRGVTHEIVRHRIASYSQESTCYCDYNKDHIEFIIPPWVNIKPGEYNSPADVGTTDADTSWIWTMCNLERCYKELRENGWSPQQARSVLPNSLKTEIVMTANLREWRHFFTLRTSKADHPQIREIATLILNEFKRIIPIVFDDIKEEI